MESVNLIESFSLFKEDKNIDRATLMSIIEDVFRTMLIKKYGSDKNFDIIVNPDKGDIEIYKNRTIQPKGSIRKNIRICIIQSKRRKN